jgi:prevent-host-death family protein
MAAAHPKHTVEPPAERSANAAGPTLDASDAPTLLSGLLEDVQQGKSITITRHGVPVAVLAPPDALGPVADAQDDEAWLDQAIAAWRRYRAMC